MQVHARAVSRPPQPRVLLIASRAAHPIAGCDTFLIEAQTLYRASATGWQPISEFDPATVLVDYAIERIVVIDDEPAAHWRSRGAAAAVPLTIGALSGNSLSAFGSVALP